MSTTTNACGLGFGLGLVSAVTAAIIWRSRFAGAVARWFWYRKEEPKYRYPFPRLRLR